MTRDQTSTSSSGRVVVIDPLLGRDGADRMVARCRELDGYGMYSAEGFDTGYTPGLPERWDSVRYFLEIHAGATEDRRTLAARTNYFRETYAYGEDVRLAGIDELLHHPSLLAAAREVHGAERVVPAIVYANILVPGQELVVHTDVPEFRGANRRIVPQWLLVVMRHSGLFEPWRMKIATAISYFGPPAAGGALRYFPDGPAAPPHWFRTEHDTAIVLDTDTVFHGVDRVAGTNAGEVGRLRPGLTLRAHEDRWEVIDELGERQVDYPADEIRFSVSWKAYCFEDADAEAAWRGHADDLTLDQILDTLEGEARDQGALDGPRPAPRDFADLLIDRHYRRPPVAAVRSESG